MAATDTEICNLALGLIQADPITDLTVTTDQQKEARLCRLFYANARDTLLAIPFTKPGKSWAFATVRTALIASSDDNYSLYEYMYDVPDGTETPAKAVMVRPIVLLTSDYYELPNMPFLREGSYIYTNLDDAYLKYVSQTAATDMPEWFVIALAWKLATYLVKPLKATAIADPWVMAQNTLIEAIAANDTNSVDLDYDPNSLTEGRFGG